MKDLAFLKITVQRYGMMGRMKREKGVENEIEVEIEDLTESMIESILLSPSLVSK